MEDSFQFQFSLEIEQNEIEMNKILAFLIAFMAISATNAQCPWNMVIRAGWAARPANTGVLPIRPAPFVVIHHTAGAACTNQATCAAQMRVAQNWHMGE